MPPSASSCEPCRRFRSERGLLVRAFECAGDWEALPAAFRPNVSWSAFDSYTHGARLLAAWRSGGNSSSEHARHFRECARRELQPGDRQPRPTSVLREGAVQADRLTYANAFGLILRSSTCMSATRRTRQPVMRRRKLWMLAH